MKPYSQGTRSFQVIHRFLVLAAERVRSFVALDAQDVEELFDLRSQPQFAVQVV